MTTTARGLPTLVTGTHGRPSRPPRSLGTQNRLAKSLRSLASRPVDSVGTTGRAAKLFAEVVRYSVTDALSGRLPVGELVDQAWTLYKVTALPAILMAIPFGGMVAVQISGLINQVGATSLVGAASGVGIVRQGAPITAGSTHGWCGGSGNRLRPRCAGDP